jgi:hypothetical protein
MASGLLGIGLVVAGTIAIAAASFFTGGLALGLLAGGTLALGAGAALSSASQVPDPVTQVQRQSGTADDPETPRELVYGEVVKGAFRAWQGVGGNKDKFSGVDDVIAPHPCEALLGLQVGEWYLPIVTDNAGDPNANGLGLILNEDRTPAPYDNLPNDWYVPVSESPWHANDQSTKDLETWHIAVKWNNGDQTATDSEMAEIFGEEYSSVARKFTGHSVVHIIFIARDNLGTAGQPPGVKYLVQGKNDIRSSAGIGSEAYRTNAADVFADFTKERLGIGPGDYVNLADAEDECDDEDWDPQGTAKRYTFNGVIRDDMEILEGMRLISAHFAGGWFERGDKIGLWTGSIKTPWADGPLDEDDYAGPLRIAPPDQDNWVNTLVVHRVVNTILDDEDKVNLHGMMEPAQVDVTDAAYVTEDGGETLVQDIKFQGITLARRAKFLAWTSLKQTRLGASYVRRFKKRTLVLEVGDVVEVDDEEWVPNGTLFRVVGKNGPDPRDLTTELTLARYEDAIYVPGTTVTEDSIGRLPKRRRAEVPVLTGLAAVILDDSVQILANGNITIDAEVSWNEATSLYVFNSGDVRVAWKKQSQNWPKKALTVPGDQVQTVLPGLVVDTPYHIRARFEGSTTAGRAGKPTGEWVQISFTPTTDFKPLGSPPGILKDGINLVDNPRFEQGPVGWDLTNLTGGSVAWLSTGGFAGGACARMIVTTGDQQVRPNADGMTPVEIGQRHRFRLYKKVTANSGTARVILQVLYYDEDKQFITSHGFDLKTNNNNGGALDSAYARVRGQHAVPNTSTIRFMRIQARGVFVDAAFTVLVDSFLIERVIGGVSTMLTAAVSINLGGTGVGDVWTNVRSITVSTPGEPVYLECAFDSRLGDPDDAGTGLGSDNELKVRFVRYDEDGTSNETVIAVETALGDIFPMTPGGGWGDWGARRFDALDETEVRGTYVYRCQFRCNTNGKAAVRERAMKWSIGAASTSS